MKAIFLILYMCSAHLLFAQNTQQQPLTVTGNIIVPSLMSMDVHTNYGNVSFTNPSEFQTGKYLSGFLKLRVTSTQPWIVSFKAQHQFFIPVSPGGSENMPSSVLQLKRTDESLWQNLSQGSKTLMVSNTNNIVSEYFFDAKFNLGWKYKSGNYTNTIIFTLSAQ
jgi:hypothetical protein